MATVHRLPHPAVAGPTIGPAVAGFLGGFTNANTARSYAVVLRALAAEFGEATRRTAVVCSTCLLRGQSTMRSRK